MNLIRIAQDNKEKSVSLSLNEFSNETSLSNTFNSSVSMMTDEETTFSYEDLVVNPYSDSLSYCKRSTNILDQLNNPDYDNSWSTNASGDYWIQRSPVPFDLIPTENSDLFNYDAQPQHNSIYSLIYQIDEHLELDFTKLLQIKIQSPEENNWNEIDDMFEDLVHSFK